MPQLSWVATEATTGRILAYLPGLIVPKVKQTIGRYEPAQAELPLPTAPVDWQRIAMAGATHLNLISQPTDAFGQPVGDWVPIWGGRITQDILSEGDTVVLPMATLESYLDGRFVGDETYTQVGQNDIFADLVTKYVAAGPDGGIPIRVEYVTPGAGKLRDREYKDQDDKTIYSVFTDLMGVIDGPEWFIGWERQHNPERITPVAYVGDRIGSPVTPGFAPAAVFSMPGAVKSFSRVRDYSAGKGATTVMATSSGQGTIRPQSTSVTSGDPLRPTSEYRWTPSTSITQISTLQDYAEKASPALAGGTISLALSAVVSAAPKLDEDWSLGDDIGFSIGGTVMGEVIAEVPTLDVDTDGFALPTDDMLPDADGFFPRGLRVADSDGFFPIAGSSIRGPSRELVPAFPGGYQGVARATAWELEMTDSNGRPITPTITPILTGTQIV